ncbi:unnamed protein product [Victoria cruziana]
MASAAVEKTAEELRKEIEELHRQQREITERLRDPRGIRRGGLAGNGPRNFGTNGGRGFGRTGPLRGFVRPGESIDPEDLPAPKRRLLSAVVKVEDGELADEGKGKEAQEEEDVRMESRDNEQRENSRRGFGGFRKDVNQRVSRMGNDIPTGEPVPRVLPKDEDPTLVNRNKRMLGRLLGTLTKFQEEDKQLSSTEAYMRRSDSLKRAEERAREESEKLRQQEREQLAEKRRRDLTLRARVAAKAEEKKLELIFLRWAEHHKKLCNFLRYPVLVLFCRLLMLLMLCIFLVKLFTCFQLLFFLIACFLSFLFVQVISTFGPKVSMFPILLRTKISFCSCA